MLKKKNQRKKKQKKKNRNKRQSKKQKKRKKKEEYKKKLKELGMYKKEGRDGSTEFGGFGGIGVENWILQNGGSFITAMETFLDATKDENGKDVGFEEFKKRSNFKSNIRIY